MDSEKEHERTVQKLFREFINLRQSEVTPEQAWLAVRKMGADLNSTDKRQLAMMVQTWEARYGHQYRSDVSGNVHTTMTMSKVDGQQSDPLSSRTKALTSRPIPGDQTQPLMVPGPARANDYFGPDTILLLYIEKEPEPLKVLISDREDVMIGRSAPDSILLPDVDLGRHSSHKHQMGISRVHAMLRRDEDTLIISDVGSKNGTFINGTQLHAQEVRVLRDGDKVRLGDLELRIEFYEPKP